MPERLIPNIDRLVHLIGILREVENNGSIFNMDVWATVDPTKSKPVAGCAIGWAMFDQKFQDQGLRPLFPYKGIGEEAISNITTPSHAGKTGWDAVGAFFNIDTLTARHIFTRWDISDFETETDRPKTIRQVIFDIQKLLAEQTITDLLATIPTNKGRVYDEVTNRGSPHLWDSSDHVGNGGGHSSVETREFCDEAGAGCASGESEVRQWLASVFGGRLGDFHLGCDDRSIKSAERGFLERCGE